MDKVLFQRHLDGCTFLPEDVSSLACGVAEEFCAAKFDQNDKLSEADLDDFISRAGHQQIFEDGASKPARLLLVLQEGVRHPNTFEPTSLSLGRSTYESMVNKMHLPRSWIETSSCTVYRKSDVKKAGTDLNRPKETRGWELVLSHDIKCGITTGYYRGTYSANIPKILELLKECAESIGHPLLLPVLICLLDFNVEGDTIHRNARDKVRELEQEIIEAAEIYTDRDITRQDNVSLGKLNKELVECHCKVLWKRPEAYLSIIESMRNSMSKLHEIWVHPEREGIMEHHSILDERLKFLSMKLHGISTYRQVTIARLDMLQGLVQNLVSLSIARNEQKVIFKKMERANTFRQEQQSAKKQKEKKLLQKELENYLESRKQMAIGYVSVFFIPGAFIAAIFSTSFFDFHAEPGQRVTSKLFWIYWIITVPFTVLFFMAWAYWRDRTENIISRKQAQMRAVEAQQRSKLIHPIFTATCLESEKKDFDTPAILMLESKSQSAGATSPETEAV